MQLNTYIDHTLLKPTALITDIQRLCDEAREYSFAAVCVPPPLVTNALKFLSGSAVKTATVIGFPFGYSNVHAKKAEISQAIKDGAHEFDMVINLIALKNKAWKYLESEIQVALEIIREHQKVIKVIIESGLLTEEEIITCCEIYGNAGVDYVKTSTGYADKGAGVEAVKLIRSRLPGNVLVKASGGIKSYAFAKELIEAGASRLGTSSGVAIMKGEGDESQNY